MIRKLLVIFSALLIAASLCACGNGNEEETTDNKIDINVEEPSDTNTIDESDSENQGNQTEIGDPGEYTYDERNETVYVNNPGSAVSLRSETYEQLGSIEHGTELTRKGVSTDADGYWSMVEYDGTTCYIATRYLTVINTNNPDEGFEEVTKTVKINEATGSLNVRNLPSMEGSVIGHVQTGNDIKVIAENTETGWYKVEFVNANGEDDIGYIASNTEYFVQEETEAPTEAEGTEAATEAGTEASAGK